MSKIVAIGDLHGHYNQFIDLFEKLVEEHEIKPEEDTLVFLGDYVDGGPDTKSVINELIVMQEEFPHWKFLFGNHESLMLDALNKKHPIYGDYYLWYKQGGKETLDSYKPSQSTNPTEYEKYQHSIMQPLDVIPEEHLNFIRNLDLYYETPDYFFVHGGIYPNRSIEDHLKAVEEDYPSGFHPDLMKEGDMAYDMIWMREPFIPSDYDWGKQIIFGHTTWPYWKYWGTDPDNMERIQRVGYPFIMDNKIGIDTMRHNDGRLTAVILPSRDFVFSGFTYS